MNDLYNGELKWENAEEVFKNSIEIREALKQFSPDKVIWDIEDLDKRPPWGDDISDDITSLANYFVTSDGNDMFDVLISALVESIRDKTDVSIG